MNVSALPDEVDEGEDRDPDDVDKVPVERRDVYQERVPGAEPALDVDREQGDQPQDAGRHVCAVKAGEREERRAEQVGANRESLVHERRELVRLVAQESDTE